jgi:hypothetical protein
MNVLYSATFANDIKVFNLRSANRYFKAENNAGAREDTRLTGNNPSQFHICRISVQSTISPPYYL